MKRITSLFLITLAMLILSCGNDDSNTSTNSSSNDSNTVDENHDYQDYYEEADEEYITDDDLVGLSVPELRIERNEIFAKYGYIFKSQDLSEYFSQFSWYNPQYDNVDDMLTDADEQNLSLIQAYETDKKNKKANFDEFLTIFEDITDSNFEITYKSDENYELTFIEDEFAKDFFGMDPSSFGDDCNFIQYYAIAKFNIPNSTNIGLLTTSQVCPVPAIHEEIALWIFDSYGNKIDVIDFAYLRGGGGETTEAATVFANNEFIQTVTEQIDDPANQTTNTNVKKYKLGFMPITSYPTKKEL